MSVTDNFKGLNNLLPESEQSITSLRQALNIDMTNTGGFRMRKGALLIKAVGSFNPHSFWSDNKICLIRIGTTLQSFNGTTLQPLRSDLDMDLVSPEMSYLSILGNVYYSDGKYMGIIESGVDRSWGLKTPPSPVLTVKEDSIDRMMNTGTYAIITTYVRNDGQESGASPITEITLTNTSQYIQVLTEPSSDPAVSNIAIYVTTPNGTEFTLYTEVTNAINTVYIDRLSFLDRTLTTQYLSPLPAGVFLTYHAGRIFVVRNTDIWHTEPFAYELCRVAKNFISFDTQINMLAAVDGGLWVGLEDRTLFLNGDTPPFRVAKEIPYGVVYGQWATDVPGEVLLDDRIEGKVLLWQSKRGMCLGGSNGLFRNLTENTYSFPQAVSGHGMYVRNNELDQFVVLLQDIADSIEKYVNFITGVQVKLPGLTGSATGV